VKTYGTGFPAKAEAGTQWNKISPQWRYIILLREPGYLFLLSLFLLTAHPSFADQSTHNHKGVLTPYEAEPEKIVLTEKEFKNSKKPNPSLENN
jgi:hypothetical protein